MPKIIKITQIFTEYVLTAFKCTLTELNEQFAITSPLVWRQGQDAGYVIIFCGLFFLHE